MSAAVASEILHVPGRLIVNPTTLALASAPDFGGTPIGNAAEVVVRIDHRDHLVRAEEFGNEIVEVVEAGEDFVMAMFLRGFDVDAMLTVFENSVKSSLTGKPVVSYPGSSIPAGSKGSDRAVRLLYAPENTEEHPAVLMYRGIPLLEEAAQIRFGRSLSREFGTPAIFRGIRDSSNRLYQIALLEDLPQVLP